MKELAVCIPNYNRPGKLDRLLKAAAGQIDSCRLYSDVEICVSDDCSTEDIQYIVEGIWQQYPQLSLKFHKNERNMGMDHNFLNCVLMSHAEYCWIIGNDDLPTEDGLKIVLEHLNDKDEKADVLVCPFDVYGEDGTVKDTIYPIKDDGLEQTSFHTANMEEYFELIERVNNGNALFCFLSNVVFRRDSWIRHGDMFQDKMNSIFIQMYMNLQTLKEGAVYRYVSEKFIKNYTDDETNAAIKREYDVLVGMSDVIDYFFAGKNHRKLQKIIVDERINGRMWGLLDGTAEKQRIMRINSPKNELYRKYFIALDKRRALFERKNVLIYGAGDYGRKALKELRDYDTAGIMVFDADAGKWGSMIEGAVVYPAKDIASVYHSKKCIVVVANNKSLIEIVETLRRDGIDKMVLIT